ncbi:hypothetical protein NDU88_006464 [Pleurodeles waltl]|uniref:Uncharacterized protein n=1 Tax=Pleurodeles waltl TaxID=8319 RepID=A0AAV7RMK9_PLEWA|nr:hypothetical protein NDU88_006464 [Pleurodeles waltl]
MAGPQGRKACQEPWPQGARGQSPGWGPPPRGLPEPWHGDRELKPEGEASPGLVDSQAWAPHGTAGWRMGASVQGPSRGCLNTATQGRPPRTPSQVPCHTGAGTKPRKGARTLGPARALARAP